MKFAEREKRILRFLLLFIGMYAAWKMLYEWVIHPWGVLDTMVINDSSLWAVWVLDTLGFETFQGDHATIRTIGVQGSNGLWIGDPCNGLTLFALFTLFIIAYPGKWKHKLWYIPVGIIVIHTMNIIRITALCIITKKSPDMLEFNHTYLFQIIMYGVIFVLWYLWIRKFTPKIPNAESQ